MQVAGIRRVGARVKLIEAGEPRPLAGDEVLLELHVRRGVEGKVPDTLATYAAHD